MRARSPASPAKVRRVARPTSAPAATKTTAAAAATAAGAGFFNPDAFAPFRGFIADDSCELDEQGFASAQAALRRTSEKLTASRDVAGMLTVTAYQAQLRPPSRAREKTLVSLYFSLVSSHLISR